LELKFNLLRLEEQQLGNMQNYLLHSRKAFQGGWVDNLSLDLDQTGSTQYGDQTGAAYTGETKTGGRSIEFRFKADSLPPNSANGYTNILSSASTGGTVATGTFNIGVRVRAATFTTPRIDLTTRQQSNSVNDTDGWIGSTTISTGTKYHVCLTTDGTNWTMYLNGSVETMGTWAGVLAWDGEWFGDQLISGTITGRIANNAANALDGHLNEIVMWDGELSSSEVSTRYNSGTSSDPEAEDFSGGSGPTVSHYHPCGEGSGDTTALLTDVVGSDDFTLYNTPSYSSDV